MHPMQGSQQQPYPPGMIHSAQQQKEPPEIGSPSLSGALMRAQALNGRLRGACCAMERMADDLRGPEPPQPAQPRPETALMSQPTGTVFQLREAQEETVELLARLENGIARLQMVAG